MRKKNDIGRIEPPPDRIGWVRVTPGYPAAPQVAALKSAGVKNIYSTAEKDTLDDMLRYVRKGTEVWMLGAHRLATTLSELGRALNHLNEIGASVYDIEKDAKPGAGEWASLREAQAVIRGEIRQAARKKGAPVGGRPRKDGGVSEDKARALWFDHSIPTNAAAAAKARWSLKTMSRKFGASGRPVGWPNGKSKRVETETNN